LKERSDLLLEVKSIQWLVFVQRLLRGGLRSLWLAGAGWLLAWGANQLWGWLPDERTWLLAALTFALIPALGLLFAWRTAPRLVWRIDRRFGFHEQLSTAWSVAEEKAQPRPLEAALIRDAARLLPEAHWSILRRGWYLAGDLVSAALILVLLAAVFASRQAVPLPGALGDIPSAIPLPAPGEDPTAGDLASEDESSQPGEQPGEQPGAQPGQGQDQPAGSQPGEQTPMDPRLGEVLSQLGEDLAAQAGTSELGEALQNLDTQGAADSLEKLAGQAGELSPETRENMRQALERAAGELGSVPSGDLPQDLQDLAESLQGQGDLRPGSPSGLDFQRAAGEVASDLRELQPSPPQQQAGGGGGAGEGSTDQGGPPPQITRLDEEGGVFELEVDPSDLPVSLSPGDPAQAGAEVLSEGRDAPALPGEAVDNFVVPFEFPWKWRDVVSSFFQRR